MKTFGELEKGDIVYELVPVNAERYSFFKGYIISKYGNCLYFKNHRKQMRALKLESVSNLSNFGEFYASKESVIDGLKRIVYYFILYYYELIKNRKKDYKIMLKRKNKCEDLFSDEYNLFEGRLSLIKKDILAYKGQIKKLRIILRNNLLDFNKI